MGWSDWFNPVKWVSSAANAVSKTFQSVGSVLAKIDPGPAIGSVGAQLDKAVGQVIPGGWAMVGAIALTVLSAGTIDLEPEVLAAAEGVEIGSAGGAGVGLTSGAVDVALQEGLMTPLQSALMSAGKTALVSGLTSGTMAAIQGRDPLKAALKGAFYGGVTGGALSAFTEFGVPDMMARALASATTGAVQGQDLSHILQNSVLSTGLGAVAGQTNQYVDPTITNAATGAIGSAIRGGDPLTGAISGAAGSLIGQGVSAVKNEFNSLMAPTASAAPINEATGQPWSQTEGGIVGNGGMVTLGNQQIGVDLANKYLTSASQELSTKVADLLPEISEQRAALLDQADKVKSTYDEYTTKQTELKSVLDGDYKNAYAQCKIDKANFTDEFTQYNSDYQKVLSLESTCKLLYSNIEKSQAVYDTNKAAYQSNQNDTTAFNAANTAANNLNSLIPQYNTIAKQFTDANTTLAETYKNEFVPAMEAYKASNETLQNLFETNVKPLQTELATLNKTLTDQTNIYSDYSEKFDDIVDTASSYITGLTDISKGQLPTDYKAAELSMSAPVTQGFSEQELAAISQGQQDAVEAAGTGTQTAATNNVGYVPPSTDVNYSGNNVEVTAPEGDFTNAEPIPIPPVTEEPVTEEPVTEEPVTEEPAPKKDLSQEILDTFDYGEGMTLQHMGDDRWVVVDSNTGAALGEINAPATNTEAPVEPTPDTTGATPDTTGTTPDTTGTTPDTTGTTPDTTGTTPDTTGTTPDTTGTTPDTTGTTPDTTGTTPDTTGTTPDTTGTTPDTTGTTPDTTGTKEVPFGAMDDEGNIMPGWSQDENGEWKFDESTLPTTEEPTTPNIPIDKTATGTGPVKTPTSTGKTKTSTGTGSTSTGTSTPSLPTMKAAVAAAGSSRITDLTPQLTKATPFKFANQPTFTDELTPMGNQTPFDYTSQILNAASGGSTSTGKSIADLKPQLTSRTAFQFANNPIFSSPLTQTAQTQPMDYTQQILNAAAGGLVPSYAEGSGVGQVEGVEVLKPQTVRGRHVPAFFQGAQMAQTYAPRTYAEGGDVGGHNPQFFSEGGLGTLQNTFVKGDGDGTSDSIPAMLANGEFVVPADVVSSLGNGSNDSGAQVLDEFLKVIRQHKRKADAQQLPPDSKGALGYLLEAKRKVG